MLGFWICGPRVNRELQNGRGFHLAHFFHAVSAAEIFSVPIYA